MQNRAEVARIVGFTPTYGIYKVILPNQRVVTAKNPLPRHMEEPAIIDAHKTNNPVTQTSPEEPAAISASAQTSASAHTSPPQTPERGAIPGTYPPTGQKPMMPKPTMPIPVMPKLVPAASIPKPAASTPQKPRELTGAFSDDWRQHGNTWPEALAALDAERQLLGEAARDPSPPPAPAPSPAPLRRTSRTTAGKAAVRLGSEDSYLTIQQALVSDDRDKWQIAAQRELAMLEKYDVYEWVDEVPVGAKVIDTKWVLKEKREKDANDPKRFNARLTA